MAHPKTVKPRLAFVLVMRSLPAILLLLLLAVSLGGCSSKAAAPTPATAGDLDLQATATTGVIRGVVVDEAIRPLAGAAVTATAQGHTLATNSTASGSFGFQGLPPGTYIVKAHKAGFKDVQTSAEVKAGVGDPAPVKVTLGTDTSFVRPYAVGFVFRGFIDCGVTTPAVGIAVCSIPNGPTCGADPVPCTGNVTADNFAAFVPVDGGVPLWIQHELVWKATQTAGDQFTIAARTGTAAQFKSNNYERDLPDQPTGTSPLLAVVNTTTIQKFDIGRNGTGLEPAIFTGGVPGTGDQVCEPVVVPAPEPVGPFGGFCLFDTGATLEQDFTLYTHIFYGFTPPAGYRFTADGEPTPPQ
ncbi:MAG: Carboxypeptidase regulatory-like domain [Thermoplasmata archaeon]|nr:Carboxypeptidase regulatory-like domain [Thermoplasmata archaeon]